MIETPTMAARAEQSLSQSQVTTVLDSIAEGLCVFDGKRTLLFCNQRYAEMYSLPASLTVPGTPHQAVVDYRLGQGMQRIGAERSFTERHEELMRLGQASVERVELGDGRVIAIRHQPLPGGGWVATHDEVTAEVRLSRDLEVKNMLFAAALDNMRQGLCMYDRERRLILSNRRYAEMYGLDPAAVRAGMTLAEVLHQRMEAGNVPKTGEDAFVSPLALVGEGEPTSFLVELTDGRTIAIVHQPLADGGYVATHEDVTEQRHSQERIRHLTRHDSLTDLPNRVSFDEQLREVHARAERGEMMAVLAIDLDHFQTVNDALGRGVGDEVLKRVAKRLQNCTKEATDVVCRLGGDEFGLLRGNMTLPEDAGMLANEIIQAIAEPIDVNGHQVSVGASVGIAVAPIDSTDGEQLGKYADLALHRAKAEGRSCYHFYEGGLDAALQERRAMEASLRSAVWKRELRLVFQPILRLADNRIGLMEALLRWDHPTLGPLEPKRFVPLAEETGMIASIGEWVLHEACATAASWPAHVGVAVNLSAAQLGRHHSLVKQVQTALLNAGLDPRRLELEVTESVLLADSDEVLATLRSLKALGVRIAMDDFGTGYSSLSHLRRFPFDRIKIDQSFVQTVTSNDYSLAITKAVIGLGHSLGITTTAEGIETEDQLEALRREGCTEAQGFLFSRPLPASGVAALLQQFEGAHGSAAESRRTAS